MEKEEYICIICGKPIPKLTSLCRRERNFATNGWNYYCETCSRKIFSRKNLGRKAGQGPVKTSDTRIVGYVFLGVSGMCLFLNAFFAYSANVGLHTALLLFGCVCAIIAAVLLIASRKAK